MRNHFFLVIISRYRRSNVVDLFLLLALAKHLMLQCTSRREGVILYIVVCVTEKQKQETVLNYTTTLPPLVKSIIAWTEDILETLKGCFLCTLGAKPGQCHHCKPYIAKELKD